jgi:signal peptidase I
MAQAEKEEGGIVEFIKTVFWALIIAGVFRTLFFQPFWIPSASMKDTLLIGDFLFVNKMAYGYSRYSCPFALCPITGRIFATEPERGDVIVFRHPVNGEDFIKRLIGLPGDKVQVKDGLVYINGTVAPQEPAGTFEEVVEPQGPMGNPPRCESGARTLGEICSWSRSTETLPNGVAHDVLNITTGGGADDTDVFTVPAGEYFFMGDNRDDSLDSRFAQSNNGVGFVPAENLIGRADRVIFSSAGRSLLYVWTWRLDRFFHAVE